MTPRQALAICELSALAPRQEVTHSAAKVVDPNTMPLSMQRKALDWACLERFSGVSNLANAFKRASSRICGFENCLMVTCRANSLASAEENCFIAACRSFSLTSGLAITSLCRALWASLYFWFSNRALALMLRLVRHSSDQRICRCFAFVSSETTQPDAPSPPSVRLHKPWSLYLRINSFSSSKAHHSCIPCCTISMV